MGMKSNIAALGVSLAMLAPAAALAQQEMVTGYWDCSASQPGIQTINRIEVGPNGEMSAFVKIIVSPTDGAPVELYASASGSWIIENNQIVEDVRDAMLHELKIDGALIAPSAVQADFRSDMIQSARLPILQLEATTLVYQDGEYSVSCNRI